MADFFAFCHYLNQLIRKVLRMRSHKTDALQSFHFFQHGKKLGKGHWIFQSFSVGIYILSQKHYFGNSVCHKTFHFLYNGFRFPASLSSSNIRHNTVATEVIAAKHDIYTGFERIVALCGKILHDLIRSIPDIHDLHVR